MVQIQQKDQLHDKAQAYKSAPVFHNLDCANSGAALGSLTQHPN